MIKPHNKLPFRIEIEDGGHLDLMSKDDTIVAEIFYASDAQYIEDACNNYQDATKMIYRLKEALSIAKIDGDYLPNELIQLNKVESDAIELLKKINYEKSSI